MHAHLLNPVSVEITRGLEQEGQNSVAIRGSDWGEDERKDVDEGQSDRVYDPLVFDAPGAPLKGASPRLQGALARRV